MAHIKQESTLKPLILYAGNIFQVMQEFENVCVGYFDTKDIAEDRRVWKILAGFRDLRIHDWVSIKKDCLQTLSFKDFIGEF